MTNKMLQCRHCKTGFPVEQVFDAGGVCWPQQHWISFNCPKCDKESKIEIEKTTVSLGDIDGAPGPCFFPDSTIKLPGLKTNWVWWGVELQYGDRTWRFKKK
jgi:hypothetical protein